MGLRVLALDDPSVLLECLFKLATAWVAPRMKAAQRAHRRASDQPAPAPPSGRLHSQQLFDSGEHSGCHQALIILISVMQGLKLQGMPFYLIYTDVKGAFPGVPTEFEGQRYNSIGIEDSDRLFAFLTGDRRQQQHPSEGTPRLLEVHAEGNHWDSSRRDIVAGQVQPLSGPAAGLLGQSCCPA
jgi:hypothetical protein